MDNVPTIEKILVPLDGSGFAEQSLPYALGAASRNDATLLLVHAQRTDVLEWVTPDSAWEDALRNESERYLDKTAYWIREETGIPAETEVVQGTPVYTVAQYAERAGVHLVVLTTHGRGGLSRAWLGSVSDGLIRSLEIPILLVRPGENLADRRAPVHPRRVLIPLDGSRLSERILPHAIALAGESNVDYLLLHAIAPALRADGRGIHVDEVREEEIEGRAHRYLTEMADRLRARGLQVELSVQAHPSPPQAILEAAIRQSADLIAMTTHGRGGLSRLVLGSTADKVIRDAPVPVLVFRPPEG